MGLSSLGRLLLLLPACFALPVFAADETIPLSAYLERANASGLRIIHSSDLVPARFQVTFDNTKPITLEKVRRALAGFDLILASQPNDIWVVMRQQPAQAKADEIPAVRPDIERPRIEEVIVSGSL
ncbi:MAG: hypothetical protein KDI19_02205, partial [Pseudomonadales bacterium]|nr:hypothetical protein [Pseudomonadales bacterium]